MDENFSRILNKLEKNEPGNTDGTIALIQGKVAQIFDQDAQRAIDRYRLALQKNHPQACYLLGAILVENRSKIKGASEESSSLLLRGWLEFQDVNCLIEYIRLSFFLGNDDEGTKYYQILKFVRDDAPHIIEYMPVLYFPKRLPLLVDYLKRHHAGEYATTIKPQVYHQAIQWIRAYLITLNDQKENLMESMTKLEENGEDTIWLEVELR